MVARKRPVMRRKTKTSLRGNYVPWTPEMEAELSDLWRFNTGRMIADYLSRKYERSISESSVLGKGRYMELGRKSKTVGRPRTKPAKPRKVARRAARRG